MTIGKTLVILNPVANKGKARDSAPGIRARLEKEGIPNEIVLTDAPDRAWQLAARAASEGFSTVVAAGGDGTANEVVNGLMEASQGAPSPLYMGLLPIGRGNDFAAGADVPQDFGQALDCLVAGQTRPMDLGLIKGGDYPQGRYFCNGVGIGFDTIVGLEAAKMTWARGAIGYIVGALKTFIAYPTPPDVTLRYAGNEVRCSPNIINIMNGRRLGGIFWMAPEGRNWDGLFDLCMPSRSFKRNELLGMILKYTKGAQAGDPRMIIGRGARFEIDAPGGGLVVHADGETICLDGTRLEIDCLPGRIPMICRAERARP
jgi:YegS/Rv2252/BmrU family lipid kinase